MILTPEQIAELTEAAKSLMLWLENNCHPHCQVIVDSHRAQVVEGLATVIRKD